MKTAKANRSPSSPLGRPHADNPLRVQAVQEQKKCAYASPELRVLDKDILSLSQQAAFLKVKYVYLSDVHASGRDTFIDHALIETTVSKFRLISEILPRTYENSDVLIAGGNDPVRLGAFIKVNLPLLRQTPKIALTHALSPVKRAHLLNMGYDDVVNTKTTSPEEFLSRFIAIWRRYKSVQLIQTRTELIDEALSHICEYRNLTASQQRVLLAMYEKGERACTHAQLRVALSRDHIDPSDEHLRVIIHGIRACLKKGAAIESVRGIGYRLVATNN